nr:PAS domain-containing protein [Calditrichia bacterium]
MQENLLSSQETVLFKQIGQSNGSETSNELNRLRNENAALKARIREREKQLVALESVVEGTLTGFWNWDLPANYQYHSPTFLNMFGYEAGELRPTPESWKNLIYPEDLPAVLATVDQVLKTGEPSAREVR